MRQPTKNGLKGTKKQAKKFNVRPPVDKNRDVDAVAPRKKRVIQQKKPKQHPEYGTSKLEERFAKNFLDRLKVKYIYQFKAESIGRYFDYFLPEHNLIIEVDGEYWHSHGLVYEEMTPTQKRNKRVDEEKNHWCIINRIKLIRIWENDINKHPEKVMEMLRRELGVAKEEMEKKKRKNQRH